MTSKSDGCIPNRSQSFRIADNQSRKRNHAKITGSNKDQAPANPSIVHPNAISDKDDSHVLVLMRRASAFQIRKGCSEGTKLGGMHEIEAATDFLNLPASLGF